MTLREASKGVVKSGGGTYNIGFNDGDETQFDVQNLEELRECWYMAGGNILYTSDSRFKQITGISYPIAIHDRYEGR